MSSRHVFLTGASSGIGRAIAELLLRHEFQVWGISRRAEQLPKHPHFHPLALDLTRLETLAPAWEQALGQAGHFDGLINNAGSGMLGPLESMDAAALRFQFDLLVMAPHLLIQAALPHFRARKQGYILNITSLAAQYPIPFMGAYSMAKAALSNYTQALRLELQGTGVQACDLQPGDIHTEFLNRTPRCETVAADYEAPLARAEAVMQREMLYAPEPELVAHTVLSALHTAQLPPVVTIGSALQSTGLPLLSRVLSKRQIEKLLVRHYQLTPPPSREEEEEFDPNDDPKFID